MSNDREPDYMTIGFFAVNGLLALAVAAGLVYTYPIKAARIVGTTLLAVVVAVAFLLAVRQVGKLTHTIYTRLQKNER